MEMKRYNESLEAYDKAIELIPENNTEDLAQSWLSKGLALNKTGRQEEARTAFQKSLEFYDHGHFKECRRYQSPAAERSGSLRTGKI